MKVTPDVEVAETKKKNFARLDEEIAKLYPNSKVKLIPVGDKLLVTGQARDAAEAAQIMVLIRGESTNQQGQWIGGHLIEGTSTGLLTADEVGHSFVASQVVNLLRIPGVHQVVLRVKIAELNRTAARNFGVDLSLNFPINSGNLLLQSMLNASSGYSIAGTFDHDNLKFGINYLEQHGVVRMLSEPTLVTLSGRPASFIAGGEFAVPTVVGVQGASAITTTFRAFGAIITFLPVVLDKDHIRLNVSPEFSKVDSNLTTNGIPGLDTRAMTTTVEMRTGQTLAIAGLLDDSMTNGTSGSIPFLQQIFGSSQQHPAGNGTDYPGHAGVGAPHGTRGGAAAARFRCHGAQQHRLLSQGPYRRAAHRKLSQHRLAGTAVPLQRGRVGYDLRRLRTRQLTIMVINREP